MQYARVRCGGAFGWARLFTMLLLVLGCGCLTAAVPASAGPPDPLVEGEEATAELLATATVKASINPEGAQTTYHVDYGLEQAHETASETVTMAAEGSEAEVVQLKLKGLRAGTTYHFHFVAENENGSGQGSDQTLTTLPAVGIENESVSQVTATSARLATVINPLTLPSEYHFEYGPTAVYGSSVPVPDANAGSGGAGVAFSALVEDLTPGMTYHYRVVAHNSLGESRGADHTFTTQSGEGAGLIDGRGWELVSPPDKHGAALEAINREGGDIQAARGGEGLAYIALAPVEAQPAGNTSVEEQELLATRQGAGVWSTKDVATANEAVGRLGAKGKSEYKLFSPDLSTSVVEPEDPTLISPSASERTPYVRDSSGADVPLVTGCPPPEELCRTIVKEHEDVPPGTKFGVKEGNEGGALTGTGVEFLDATSDLADVVLKAPQALTSESQAAANPGEENLYRWSAGALAPISILPHGESALVEGGAFLGAEDSDTRNAISANGDRIFFSTSGHHLFMRDMEKHATVQLDKPDEGVQPGEGVATYQDASSEGERAFFTDEAKLTADATNVENQPDLYMCQVEGVAGQPPACNLTNLTVAANPGETADVLGGVIATSEDGSSVYFVANGILTNLGVPVAGAVRGECEREEGFLPPAGQLCNLYMWHEGVIRLVAVLSNRDFPDWSGSGVGVDLSKLTARVSPNGQFLTFMSQRGLTGYDNHDARSEEPDEEVYEYDAGTERLVCASCDPSGARPAGLLEPNPGAEPTLLVDRPGAWGEQWLAASIPGWTSDGGRLTLYQSRYLSNEGRLLFTSPADLVPAAGNGREDVYEFEPEGVGGCASTTSSASVTYVAELAGSPVGGCVGLISSGTSSEESAFLDASESGEDVFFLTAAKLATQDVDDALDVYDAHVCSTASPCPIGTVAVPPRCISVDSCRAASAPQPEVFGAPASATFSGPGSVAGSSPTPKPKPLTRAQKLAKALKRCRKDRSRAKRLRCERQARRAYGPAHPAKNAKNARANHRRTS